MRLNNGSIEEHGQITLAVKNKEQMLYIGDARIRGTLTKLVIDGCGLSLPYPLSPT